MKVWNVRLYYWVRCRDNFQLLNCFAQTLFPFRRIFIPEFHRVLGAACERKFVYKSSSFVSRFYCTFHTAVNWKYARNNNNLADWNISQLERQFVRPIKSISFGRTHAFPPQNFRVALFLLAGYLLGAGMYLADIRWHQNAAPEGWSVYRKFIIRAILHQLRSNWVLH